MSASGEEPFSPTEQLEGLKLEKKLALKEKDRSCLKKERRRFQPIHQREVLTR